MKLLLQLDKNFTLVFQSDSTTTKIDQKRGSDNFQVAMTLSTTTPKAHFRLQE